MDPKLEEYVETIQIFCSNCVNPSEQNGKKLFIPQGLGIALWHKILKQVAPLTEEQDDQVHRSNRINWAWTRLSQQLEQFVTQCISDKCVRDDIAVEVCEIASEAGRNFIVFGQQFEDDHEDSPVVGIKLSDRHLVQVLCELLKVSLQIDHEGLAVDTFVEAVVFPYARIAIGKSRSVNDQILGFKLWELAYRLQWNAVTLLTACEEEYFYDCVMNIVSLAKTANKLHHNHLQAFKVEFYELRNRAVVEPRPWRTAAQSLIAEWDKTRYQLMPALLSSLIARAECSGYYLPKFSPHHDTFLDVILSACELMNGGSAPVADVEWICYTYCKLLSNDVFRNQIFIPFDSYFDRPWEPLARILEYYVHPVDPKKEDFIDKFYLKLVLPEVDAPLPPHAYMRCYSHCPYRYAKAIAARKAAGRSSGQNGNQQCEWIVKLERLLNNGTPCQDQGGYPLH